MSSGPIAAPSGELRLSVRPAAPGDAVSLAALYRLAAEELSQLRGGGVLMGLQARREPLEGSFLSQLHATDHCLVVGGLGDATAGFGSCRTVLLSTGELLGVIDELFVAPEWRRAGVGAAMAEKLLEWCREKGCTGADASALPGSRAVKSFFESQGFTARVLVMHRRLASQ